MKFNSALKNFVLVLFSTLLISACSTAKKASVDTVDDVYTGTDTVEFLANGVPDRVFFATNKSSLTTRSRDTLRKQATYLRKNKDLTVTIEGHADERGTREYNLALGERRANGAKDYLMRYGVSGKMETWMLPRYEIDDFKFIFKTRGDDQYISFLSPQAINEIDGYITQGKRFSIATLQPEKAWYAGTFKPIKKLDQFLELSNKNTRIFCKILYEDFMLNSFNREISSYNVSQLVENAGYKCNSNFELVATGTTGSLLKKAGVKSIKTVNSGPLGGDAEIGEMVSRNEIDGVIFFRDPLDKHPHDVDIAMLMRLCDVHNIPLATNYNSACAVIKYLNSITK